MTSRVERTSRALQELGETGIQLNESNEVDEFDDEAHASLAIFDTCLPIALYGKAWSWLLRREQLNQVVISPSEEAPYPYKYAIPAPRVGSIRAAYDRNEEDALPIDRGWRRISGFIYADFQPFYLEFLETAPPETWPELFGAAFHLLLCSRLAMRVVQDPQIAALYRRQYEDAIKAAERVDSQSAPVQRIRRFGYIEARRGTTRPILERLR